MSTGRGGFFLRAPFVIWAFVAFVPSAAAHGGDANQALIRLAGDTATVVVTPSSAVFASFDDDKDGRLDVEEVARHRAELLSRFNHHFGVANEHAVPGQRSFEDLSTPHAHDALGEAGADHLRVTLRYTWPEPPTALRVQWRDAREHPLAVTATRVAARPLVHEQVALGTPEVVVLDGFRPAHAFLGSLVPVPEEPGLWGKLLTAGAFVGAAVLAFALYMRRTKKRS